MSTVNTFHENNGVTLCIVNTKHATSQIEKKKKTSISFDLMTD